MKYRDSVTFDRQWIPEEVFQSKDDLPGEEWITFTQFNNCLLSGAYQVSNKGRLRHLNGNYIKGSISVDGYHAVSLAKITKNKYIYTTMHKIVLIMFKGDPPASMRNPTVQHINHNKLDNRIENLCWMSSFDNNQEGHGTLTRVIDSLGIHDFKSQKFASVYLGRHPDYISECIHYGYKLTNSNREDVEVYTKSSTSDEWVKYTKPVPNNKRYCKLILNEKEYMFESLQACSRFLGKDERYVGSRMHDNWPLLDTPYDFYTFDVTSNEFVKYEATSFRKRYSANKCKITVCNSSTIFNSIAAAARYLGKDYESLRSAIHKGGKIVDSNGNIIKVEILD